MLSIIINAYACSPNMGSEPGMAWNWCVNLANYCELHIITEEEFRDKIEEVLPTLPQGKNMHFYYNTISDRVRKMCWNQGDWRFYLHYKKWQKHTLKIAKDICLKYHIDVIHQLNMVGFREPGYLWKMENIPFVWGPIGGMNLLPVKFLRDAPLKQRLFARMKNVITDYQRRFDLRIIKAMNKADVRIAATKGAFDFIDSYYSLPVVLINETGCSNININRMYDIDSSQFNILWVGRFIETKQLYLAMDTLSRVVHLKNIHLHIVGQSVNACTTEKYIKYAKDIGISSCCTFYGQIDNSEVQKLMQNSQLFFFTSIMEATSTVILEAISNKLPILCFNTCGFGPIVNERIGAKIELTTKQNAIVEFANIIEYMYNNPNVLEQMSANCYSVQQTLTWESKVKKILELYNKAIDNK
ncbi:MAG: glycosyltransferase [Rikenellaceae bacterium]